MCRRRDIYDINELIVIPKGSRVTATYRSIFMLNWTIAIYVLLCTYTSALGCNRVVRTRDPVHMLHFKHMYLSYTEDRDSRCVQPELLLSVLETMPPPRRLPRQPSHYTLSKVKSFNLKPKQC